MEIHSLRQAPFLKPFSNCRYEFRIQQFTQTGCPGHGRAALGHELANHFPIQPDAGPPTPVESYHEALTVCWVDQLGALN